MGHGAWHSTHSGRYVSQSTPFLGGSILDLKHGETIAFLEAERRVAERWAGSLEMRLLLNTDGGAPLHSIRLDHFVTFALSRFF